MRKSLFLLIAVTCMLALGGNAFAQDEGEGTAEPGAMEEAPAEEAPAEEAPAEAQPAEEPPSERDDDPMGSLGIGLKLGFLAFGSASYSTTINGVSVDTEMGSRSGVTLDIPINLGSSGFGWVFTPYLGLGDEIGSIGLYTGPTIVFHIIDPLYVGVGVGLRLGYMTVDGIDIGLDAYGRVPITCTYYVIDDLGIVAELGLGYGASGVKPEIPAAAIAAGMEEPSLEFGTTYQIDFNVGVRWP